VTRAQLDFGLVLTGIGIASLVYAIAFHKNVERRTFATNRLDLNMAFQYIVNHSDLIAVVCFFILLTILFTWPLALNFGTFINASTEDSFHELWYLAFGSSSVYGPFFTFYTNSIQYPTGAGLYFQVVSPFNTSFFLVLSKFFGDIVAFNTLYMFTFVASATTMYIFVQYLTKNKYAALVAGMDQSSQHYVFRVSSIIRLFSDQDGQREELAQSILPWDHDGT
jgi:hypothetical protein